MTWGHSSAYSVHTRVCCFHILTSACVSNNARPELILLVQENLKDLGQNVEASERGQSPTRSVSKLSLPQSPGKDKK